MKNKKNNQTPKSDELPKPFGVSRTPEETAKIEKKMAKAYANIKRNKTMNTSTEPKTYKFKTFQELVDVVPADRIRICMEEIGSLLANSKNIVETTWLLAKELAKQEGKSIEIPKVFITVPEEFEWIDDNKREIVANIPGYGKMDCSHKLGD